MIAEDVEPERPPLAVPPVRVDRRSDVTLTLERLFDTSFASLVRTLTIVAGDRQQAEDAVQEAFAQAYVHWARVQTYGDPVAWLRRVATNRILNQQRSRRRRRAAVDSLNLAPDAGVTGSPDAATTRRLDLAAMVRLLPVQQRTVVALFYYADLPTPAVAAAMSLSEGAVRYHLHAARRTLAGAMEAEA